MMNIVLEIIIIIAMVAVVVIFARRIPQVREKLPSKKNQNLVPKTKIYDNVQKAEASLSDLETADKYLEEKKFELAEKIYVRLVAQDPHNPKIYNRLGGLYLEQKNYSDAKAAFAEVLKYDDKLAGRWYNYGLACSGLLEYRNSIEAFEKAVKLERKSEKYLQALKEAKIKLKKFVEKK